MEASGCVCDTPNDVGESQHHNFEHCNGGFESMLGHLFSLRVKLCTTLSLTETGQPVTYLPSKPIGPFTAINEPTDLLSRPQMLLGHHAQMTISWLLQFCIEVVMGKRIVFLDTGFSTPLPRVPKRPQGSGTGLIAGPLVGVGG